MNELLQTDVFFYITSAAVVVVTLIVIILLIYAIGILKNFRRISGRISQEVDAISQDLDAARAEIKQESKKIFSIWNVLASRFFSGKGKKTKKSKKA